MITLSEEFDDFEFRNLFPRFAPSKDLDDLENESLSPLSCLREFGTYWLLEFDLPLVDKKDISVSLDENIVTVEAKLKEKYTDEKLGTHVEFGYFKKSTTLPGRIDPKGVKAKFSGGILSVVVPKRKSGLGIKIE